MHPPRTSLSLLPLWFCALWIGGFIAAPLAFAGTPDWVRNAARAEVAGYPEDTKAVTLYSEQISSVASNGQMKNVFRRVYKILRAQGQSDYGTAAVSFDSETKLTYFKAWSITAQGVEYEVKEKDAVETSMVGEETYGDVHYKILDIPAAAPGNVVAYEYEQIGRPRISQTTWAFQEQTPVRLARYVLELPKGWAFETFWRNHAAVQPTGGDNRWSWQVENVPGVTKEEEMPSWHSLVGWLGINYHPPSPTPASWHDVGAWYSDLSAGRRDSAPELKKQVAELTANAKTDQEKLSALATYVQHQIRYVAIEIGIGGFQPHPAVEIFKNRYGDCKDKATLLSAMLHEVGIESYYVLINVDRGVVAPDFPSPLSFNHAILAIRLPEDIPDEAFPSVVRTKTMGRLLFFDPTDDYTRLGYLSSYLQANYGLLVTTAGGELVQLPLLAPGTNRLLRTAQLTLSPAGNLSGTVREIIWGPLASERRAKLRSTPEAERSRNMEDFLSVFLADFRLGGISIDGVQDDAMNLVVDYGFLAEHYGQIAGDLMFFPPRVLGNKGNNLLEREQRKHPVAFPCTSLETDMFDITLPSGFQVDQLPAPTKIESPFAEYTSKVTVSDNVLHYLRTLQIKAIEVPVDQLDELKQFYRKIALDQRSTAILKRSASKAVGEAKLSEH